jgi:hypothetical protein
MTIGFKNFIRNNKLNESEKGVKNIEISDPQDMIFAMHYLLDYLGKYITVGDVLDFERIYNETKKELEANKT